VGPPTAQRSLHRHHRTGLTRLRVERLWDRSASFATLNGESSAAAVPRVVRSEEVTMTDTTTTTTPTTTPTTPRPPKLPPAWFMHAFWRVHRWLHRLSGGRFLWTPASKRRWGAMRLTTVGRRSGHPRTVIVGYIEDGADLVTMAMNGWDEGHPDWWLNLEANPDATVRLAHRPPRSVRARAAEGDERDRLWARWAAIDTGLDAYADSRSTVTPVVVFEPRE
jgi:deazaflavin-dependent oxidoreductase (nitroreductase family)